MFYFHSIVRYSTFTRSRRFPVTWAENGHGAEEITDKGKTHNEYPPTTSSFFCIFLGPSGCVMRVPQRFSQLWIWNILCNSLEKQGSPPAANRKTYIPRSVTCPVGVPQSSLGGGGGGLQSRKGQISQYQPIARQVTHAMTWVT